MMIEYQKYIQFLLSKKLNELPHSGSNFFDHLVKTFNILKTWKKSDKVCVAGLFHSVYGNEYYKPTINISREEVKNLVGEECENLIFKFNNCDRNKVIKEETDYDLISIISANFLSQNTFIETENECIDEITNKSIYNYFLNLPNYQFDGSNDTFLSRKLIYNLNFLSNEENILKDLSVKFLKDRGLYHLLNLKRAYASFQNYGYVGEFHSDNTDKGFNEVFTVMFYICDMWHIDFCGETVFKNNNDEIIASIIPKPKRALIFDGNIPHSPRPLSKICVMPRIVVTFKYEIK